MLEKGIDDNFEGHYGSKRNRDDNFEETEKEEGIKENKGIWTKGNAIMKEEAKKGRKRKTKQSRNLNIRKEGKPRKI